MPDVQVVDAYGDTADVFAVEELTLVGLEVAETVSGDLDPVVTNLALTPWAARDLAAALNAAADEVEDAEAEEILAREEASK